MNVFYQMYDGGCASPHRPRRRDEYYLDWFCGWITDEYGNVHDVLYTDAEAVHCALTNPEREEH